MDQKDYLTNKLKKFGLDDAKPRSTPCEVSEYESVDEAEIDDEYGCMVGSIIYAMTCTRPDLSWVVTKLSQYMCNPQPVHKSMLKHVFRYLLGSLDRNLTFTKSTELRISGYSDADWGTSKEDRKSISGYYFTLNKDGPAISWKTKKQTTIALSSCESEYIALTFAAKEALYLKQLIEELIFDTSLIVQLNVDNQGAISLARNPVQHQRSKHFDIKLHFIRDIVEKNLIKISYVTSNDNIADLMTKPCTKIKLRKFEEMLFGVNVAKC